MTNEEIIRELTSVEERYKDKPVATFEVNISSMARSCRKHIEELAKKNAKLKEQVNSQCFLKAEDYDEYLEVCKENDKLKLEVENLKADKNALAHNVVTLGNIIREKEDLWGELEKRFVTVEKVCTEEEKAKCIMFPDYCEGSCKERIDLVALLEKATENNLIN